MLRSVVAPPRRLVLLLVLLGACGGESTDPTLAFPLRLLPRPDARPVEPLLEDEFDDLAPWRVLDFAQRTLAPARGHPDIATHEGSVYLTNPWLFLVRLVELPADTGLSIVARLASEAPFEISAPCPHLFLPLVQDLLPDETAEAILASGLARTPAGKQIELGALLPSRLENIQGQGTWTAPAGADGFAQARFKHSEREQRELRALIVSALTGPVAITSLRVEPKPRILRLFDLESASAGAGVVHHPVVAPVRVAAEWRAALLVPPGAVHTITVEVPAGAEQLTFGAAIDPALCTLPEPDPPPVARWFVEIEAQGVPARTLGQSGVQHLPDRPPTWTDVRLDWPDDLRARGVVTLRFGVEGDGAVAFGQPMVRGPTASRPNVLLVSLDTVRADHVGYQGYDRPTTPFLDRFAEQSVTFLNASSVGPYTLPTHVTLFTGLLPQHHGVTDGWADRLDASRHPYLPKLLAEAGWVTAGFTGDGFLSTEFGFGEGYDVYRGVDPVIHHESVFNQRRYLRNEPPHVEGIERGAAIEGIADWIVEQDDQPWFVFVHTYAPHEYDPPAETFALFDTAPGSSWGTDARDIAERLKPTLWPVEPPGPADVEHLENLYDAALHYTDERLGHLLAELDVRGLLRDTIVIVTSDHGEELFEHEGVRHSITLYEEMLRVPLLVRAPGCLPRPVKDPVTLADVTPTVLDLLGLPIPEGSDGRSLAGVLAGGSTSELGKALLVGHVDTAFSRRSSLRVGRHKVIRGDVSERVKFPAVEEWELYDLADDPGEQENLAAERPDELLRLRQSLEAVEASLRQQAVGGAISDLSPEAIERLRELGYLGDG